MTDLPLPEPAAGYGAGCNIELTIGQHLYTADQLHAYAAAKTAALQAECARLRAVDEAMIVRALCAPYRSGNVADMLRGGGDEETAIMKTALDAALRGKETP